MAVLEADSVALWHRMFSKVKNEDGSNAMGASTVNPAIEFVKARAEQARAGGNEAAAQGYDRMVGALETSR